MGHRKSAPAPSAHRVLWARRAAWTLFVAVTLGSLAQTTYLIPDSSGTLAWGRSLLWDADVDFTNEYAAFGMIDQEAGIRFGAATPTGRPGNPFGLGTGLLCMPLLLLGRLVAALLQAFGMHVGTDGFTTGTLFAATLTTWTCVILAWTLVEATVRKVAMPGGSTRLAVAAAFLALPLPYYTLQLATYSHASSVFSVSLVVFLVLHWRAAPSARRALVVGLAVGFAALVRAQNLLYVALPLCVWGGTLRRRRHLLAGCAALLLGALLGFTPQLVAWHRLYGSVFALPQGGGFLHLSGSSLANVLFSTRHGLFTTTPVVLLALTLLWWRRAVLGSAVVLGVTCCFLLQWVCNAMPVDWWAGWSFGARRFCSLIPLLALALAAPGGRPGRAGLVGLMALNGVQWLRLSVGQLSGEGDPGFNGLWGRGFVTFLAKLPEAIGRLLGTRWDEIAVMARPAASPLRIQVDDFLLLVVQYLLWLVLLLAVVPGLRRRLGLDGDGAGNSPGAQRV